MSLWLAILAGGLITYGMRLSFIYLTGQIAIPEALQRALRFVPAAVLSAIIAPELLLHSGRLDLGPDNTRLIAGLVAVVVAWRTKNTVLTILAGFAMVLVLPFLF